nr:F-box protein At5g07610-like [Coffea arabica]
MLPDGGGSPATGPLIRHIFKAEETLLRPSTAWPVAGKSRFSLSPDSSNTLKNPPQDCSYISAAGIVVAHNEDLLTQILLCLPPKSLIRFQCVSRGWLSIISNPSFRRLYCGSSNTRALFLFRKKWRKNPELNFISFSDEYVSSMETAVSHLSSNFFTDGEITDLHSCNGLVAVVLKLRDGSREFSVYNPSTSQHRLIPQLNLLEKRHPFVALNIAFDPLKSDHYKLVCVWWGSPAITDRFAMGIMNISYGFSIYESETGTWRDSGDIFEIDYAPLHTFFRNGVLWNGCLHWITDWKAIVCFDLDKEDINFTLPSPPASMEHSGIWYFGESGGCMYFIDINNPGEMLFDVFELASGCSEWVLKHHLNLAPLTTLYPSMVDEEFDHSDDWRFRFRLTYFVEDENEKKVRLVISLLGKVILYDINDMVVKELAEVGPTDTDDDCRDNLYQWKDGYPVMKTLTYV